ncbi:MAG: DUF1810 domain-containing protein [Sphingomonas sp.]|nr:DUF1810 domain-containing protein [Sphingomonas sp.]
MADPYDLDRFLKAQEDSYDTALDELRTGRKRSHWIWFIFPQLAGLGQSPTSQFYGIKSLEEATAYLRHPILGGRLHECLKVLQPLEQTSADQVFGELDAMKFRSSLTLFAEADPADPIVEVALDRWFDGRKDEKTLQLLGTSPRSR